MPFEANLRNTCIFLAIFILAFFPNIFHIILRPLTAPFDFLSGTSAPTLHNQKLPTCHCCPPPECPQALSPIPSPEALKSSQQQIPVAMSWFQKSFTLPSKSRGSYLITDTVVKELPELKQYKTGILHLFVQHTSCGLSLNENWDEEVRADMSDALDRLAPEDRKGNLYRHSAEGPDDMPAHIKSALVGASVTVPITDGRLNLGTWQGIWYLEFRAARHSRKLVATIQGEIKG